MSISVSCHAICFCTLLTLVACLAQEYDSSVPHVDECNLCFKCIVDSPSTKWESSFDHAGGYLPSDEPTDKATRRKLMDKSLNSDRSLLQAVKKLPKPPRAPRPPEPPDPNDDPKQPPWLRSSAYLIKGAPDKIKLPNCSLCRGCNTELSFMAETTQFLDRTFTNEKGATSGWLFMASTNRTESKKAVLKVYCMPLPKKPGARVPSCAPETILKNMKLLLGLEKVAEDCGFLDIIPRLWVEKVNAVVPGIGFHIRWYGLWMEVAEGVSMENFLHRGSPSRFPPPAILDLLQNKLNRTQVIRGSIFDLLTSQCDRHAQNIFVNERGQIKLIDNEAALQNSWKNCGFNSILVPTTQKQEIARLSNEFVNKLVNIHQAGGKGHADPQLLFDYRCYLPESSKGVLGKDYPPDIHKCLTDISKMTTQEVHTRYGFVEESVAENLRVRASDMINKGFEYAFLFGEPQNAPGRKYRVQPPCCNIKAARGGPNEYVCADPWELKWELPIGDPTTGGVWRKETRPDTGTYIGGDFEGIELPLGVERPASLSADAAER